MSQKTRYVNVFKKRYIVVIPMYMYLDAFISKNKSKIYFNGPLNSDISRVNYLICYILMP